MALKKETKNREIVFVRDNNNNVVPCSFEEAQDKVNKGWAVHINKTGKKLAKQSAPKPKKASKKKAEGK